MQTLKITKTLRGLVVDWRKKDYRVAFVPTMGNLHEGHLSLIAKAKELADKVVVSIFVNPMQFGVNEDFDKYPRTLELDGRMLAESKVDALFLPTTDLMYPRSPENTTRVEVPGISDILCGQFRPGHFVGVATVVCKLTNIVNPHVLLLGEKDYQQVAVIRRMLEDLFLPVELRTVATVRESDGLAKSSRNQYLTLSQREIAPKLYEVLQDAAERALAGGELLEIESQSIQSLEKNGFRCDYFQFRDALSLELPATTSKRLVVLAAAYLGSTRLIDNLVLTLH